MLDGCHGAKTDHITVSALGRHQPIGAQHGGGLTNHSAAQGPAGCSRYGFVTVDEDWHRGLWHGSYLSLSICTWEAQAGPEWPIRGLCHWPLHQSEDCIWPMSVLVYYEEVICQVFTNLITRHRILYTSNTSPGPGLLESPSITFWLPIYHQYGERGIVRNYSGRERFEEFVCMFIPNKSLGSAQGAVLECKWAVMIISTS